MSRSLKLNDSGYMLLDFEPIGTKRKEFAARLIRAGRINNADGSQGRIFIPKETLQTAADHGQFEGAAVFVDHPGFFSSPSIRHLIGSVNSARYNSATESVDAIIRLFDNELAREINTVLNQMLDDQANDIPTPNVGVSLVFWPTWLDNEAPIKELLSFKKIDSADLVFGPAADGRILEALSAYAQKGENIMSEPKPLYEVGDNANSAPTEPTPAQTVDVLTAWRDAAGQEAAKSIILSSHLPEISKERLLGQVWSDPNQVYQAIDAERAYLAKLTEQNVISLYGGPPRQGTSISMRTGMDDMENAMNWLFGAPDAKTPEHQLRRFDNLYALLTGDYEFHGVFRPERVYLATANTTTLANLAVNAMNKVIMAQLALLTHYRWYERIAVPTPNDGSLHDMSWISFGGITTLGVVPEGGAYDEIVVDDVKETDAFVKYGGYVGITRKMIKNSDIQRIQAVPKALAAASVKTRSAKIAAIFTSNSGVGPTLDQDSTALFHSNHANLATTALGTDTTAWKAAALECFKQTEVSSADRIGVFPKFLLVPADLYHTALSIFGYGEGFPTTYLPFTDDRGVGDPRPEPIAVPHMTDTTDWAYIADPMVWPVIHMSFSADPSGRTFPAPELFSVTSETGGLMFSNDTLPIKVRDEFSYGVNGYRGIGKRNVTGS